jgi:hypothetical protein
MIRTFFIIFPVYRMPHVHRKSAQHVGEFCIRSSVSNCSPSVHVAVTFLSLCFGHEKTIFDRVRPSDGVRLCASVRGAAEHYKGLIRWSCSVNAGLKYMKAHPDITIQVTGGGSGTGIAADQRNDTNLRSVGP